MSMRITRVTTRTGDDGTTGLVGGSRVPKDHLRIAAYGTIDELSAFLGLARLEWDGEGSTLGAQGKVLTDHLRYLQNQLFVAGGDLATPWDQRHPQMKVVTAEEIAYLEELGERLNKDLPPLKDFILAGGSRTAAHLHVARTIARRAERHVITLARQEDIGPHVAVYLNRLSDTLFILARWANHVLGIADVTWDKVPAKPGLAAEE
jgi:cob(I)alamin adenosyltransferase